MKTDQGLRCFGDVNLAEVAFYSGACSELLRLKIAESCYWIMIDPRRPPRTLAPQKAKTKKEENLYKPKLRSREAQDVILDGAEERVSGEGARLWGNEGVDEER
jgi:hypothetical protein